MLYKQLVCNVGNRRTESLAYAPHSERGTSRRTRGSAYISYFKLNRVYWYWYWYWPPPSVSSHNNPLSQTRPLLISSPPPMVRFPVGSAEREASRSLCLPFPAVIVSAFIFSAHTLQLLPFKHVFAPFLCVLVQWCLPVINLSSSSYSWGGCVPPWAIHYPNLDAVWLFTCPAGGKYYI